MKNCVYIVKSDSPDTNCGVRLDSLLRAREIIKDEINKRTNTGLINNEIALCLQKALNALPDPSEILIEM